jgi:DNA-binding beta-propeller fold protein YncE
MELPVSLLKCGSLTLFLFISSLVFAATPTISVASPGNNATVGSPVYFDASASTSTCASGISAIRVYSSSGVNAFTTDSFHLETFLTLKPGTYNTVIQAWDNCGGVSKVARTITVSAKAGVSIFLPAAGSNTTPVHFAISAQNPACSSGMSAVRIYPASGVNAYTLNGPTLDAFINLIPGTYDAVAQAWDNCGNVFKTPVNINNTGGPSGKFLYIADYQQADTNEPASNVAEFSVNDGALSIPGGASAAPTFSLPGNANGIVVDPSGNFAYVGLTSGAVSVFEINRANGNLFLTQTTPVEGTGPAAVAMDPAGNFLYAAEYGSNEIVAFRINRNTGNLTFTSTAPAGTEPNAIAADFTGLYLYATNYGSADISAYTVNTNDGILTQIAGSPFATGTGSANIGATGTVVYDLANDMYGYSIDGSNGSLAGVPGSPFIDPEATNVANSLRLDPIHNLLFYSGVGFSGGTDEIFAWTIASDGAVTNSYNYAGVVTAPTALALDPSYQYLYVCDDNASTGPPNQLVSFKYSGTNGAGSMIGKPLTRPYNNDMEIAVSP